jgi:colanic acid/amylovoran biosynthesis glycosyltransferase
LVETPVALQRCGEFVGRTENWVFDHLIALPRYRPLVLAGSVQNQDEFPGIETWQWVEETLPRRAWRKLFGAGPYPPDTWRLKARRPAVLHSHFGYVATDDHGLRRALGVPWLVGFYGADVYELPRLREWKERCARIFDEAARVLPLGPVMADQLAELGCPREKLTVHGLGIDVAQLRYTPRHRREGEPLRILFAGAYREKKGIPDLIEAVHLLDADGVPVHLELIGDATSKPGDAEIKAEVDSRIARWGLERRVTRQTFLPFQELVALATKCHVLAHPSLTAASGDSEGTPFLIQQMMGTGMPVVSTRHSDIPFIFGTLADRLVPERDPVALAAALRVYADDPEAIARDGRLFREHAESQLDVRVRAAALAGIYDEVTGGGRPTRAAA